MTDPLHYFQLTGKLRRIHKGMSLDEFDAFLGKERADKLAMQLVDDRHLSSPLLSRMDRGVWEDVKAFVIAAFIVLPEYQDELIGKLHMLGVTHPFPAGGVRRMTYPVQKALGLQPLSYIENGTGGILAIETRQYWFAFPGAIATFSRRLRRRTNGHQL